MQKIEDHQQAFPDRHPKSENQYKGTKAKCFAWTICIISILVTVLLFALLQPIFKKISIDLSGGELLNLVKGTFTHIATYIGGIISMLAYYHRTTKNGK